MLKTNDLQNEGYQEETGLNWNNSQKNIHVYNEKWIQNPQAEIVRKVSSAEILLGSVT